MRWIRIEECGMNSFQTSLGALTAGVFSLMGMNGLMIVMSAFLMMGISVAMLFVGEQTNPMTSDKNKLEDLHKSKHRGMERLEADMAQIPSERPRRMRSATMLLHAAILAGMSVGILFGAFVLEDQSSGRRILIVAITLLQSIFFTMWAARRSVEEEQ